MTRRTTRKGAKRQVALVAGVFTILLFVIGTYAWWQGQLAWLPIPQPPDGTDTAFEANMYIRGQDGSIIPLSTLFWAGSNKFYDGVTGQDDPVVVDVSWSARVNASVNRWHLTVERLWSLGDRVIKSSMFPAECIVREPGKAEIPEIPWCDELPREIGRPPEILEFLYSDEIRGSEMTRLQNLPAQAKLDYSVTARLCVAILSEPEECKEMATPHVLKSTDFKMEITTVDPASSLIEDFSFSASGESGGTVDQHYEGIDQTSDRDAFQEAVDSGQIGPYYGAWSGSSRVIDVYKDWVLRFGGSTNPDGVSGSYFICATPRRDDIHSAVYTKQYIGSRDEGWSDVAYDDAFHSEQEALDWCRAKADIWWGGGGRRENMLTDEQREWFEEAQPSSDPAARTINIWDEATGTWLTVNYQEYCAQDFDPPVEWNPAYDYMPPVCR